MRTFFLASALVALMVPTSMLMAQDKPAVPAAAASMPMDCGNAMKPHDHAAEKGVALAKAKPCGPAKAASAAAAKPAHDHGKVHKQQ